MEGLYNLCIEHVIHFENITEKMIEFTEGSASFGGITMNGCYGISVNEFAQAFVTFLETGENILDEHAKMQYLQWAKENKSYGSLGDQPHNMPREKDIPELREMFLNHRHWNVEYLFPEDTIRETDRKSVV